MQANRMVRAQRIARAIRMAHGAALDRLWARAAFDGVETLVRLVLMRGVRA